VNAQWPDVADGMNPMQEPERGPMNLTAETPATAPARTDCPPAASSTARQSIWQHKVVTGRTPGLPTTQAMQLGLFHPLRKEVRQAD
jgi:hypothetical protein